MKVILTKYDKSITEPPFLTYAISDTIELEDVVGDDPLGEKIYAKLSNLCYKRGEIMQFYTIGTDYNVDFQIVCVER